MIKVALFPKVVIPSLLTGPCGAEENETTAVIGQNKIQQSYSSSEGWVFRLYGFIFKSDSEQMKCMYNKSA